LMPGSLSSSRVSEQRCNASLLRRENFRRLCAKARTVASRRKIVYQRGQGFISNIG
jgi:hypothetical protein